MNLVPVGAETRVNEYLPSLQQSPDIATLPNGGFVVTWESFDQGGTGIGAFARRFDPGGNPDGGELRVSPTAGTNKNPDVTALADGSFAVVWQDPGATSGDALDLFLRRFRDSPDGHLSDGADLGWGTPLNDSIFGLGGNDELNGLEGNDTLDGGLGADRLIGNVGNDVYIVDNTGDVVVELAGEGTDTVRASAASYTLADNVENLIATVGTGGSFFGNALDNQLRGAGGSDTLEGIDGNDILTGGDGNDVLRGGPGNDRLLGGNGDDRLDGNIGDDTVTYAGASGGVQVALDINGNQSTISAGVDRLLNVENLEGSSFDDALRGNEFANRLLGGVGDDRLEGLDGNDRLDGGVGDDTMIGGLGDDTYIVDAPGDLASEIDPAGGGGGGGGGAGGGAGAAGGRDLVTSSVSYVLGDQLDDLLLTGIGAIDGTGNGLGNTLTGNGAANRLEGGDGNDRLTGAAGADLLIGGAGDDVFIIDAADTVVEALDGGFDTVESTGSHALPDNIEKLVLTGASAINGTGNGLANQIIGNGAANILDGGADSDTMSGGAGSDTYIVDAVGDKAIEASATGGTDTVRSAVTFTLGAFVENLVLTGTGAINGAGNTLANNLTGNAANNMLNGAGGADIMRGGDGNDTYIIDDAGDRAIESSATGGTDTVQSSISFTLGTEVENLILTGSAAINGTGNTLDNGINGNGAANVLNGGGGADTMKGGGGDDTYVVDNAGDTATESSASGGTDTVRSSVSFTLTSNVETLVLTGSSAIDGTGSSLANSITGNAAANVLDGREGSDTLIGGGGADRFVFATPLGAANVDHVADLDPLADTIVLDNAVFGGLPTGALATGAFRTGTAAVDADDRIIYDQATGNLFFDADGSGGGGQILFAVLNNAPASLSAADFTVI
jgi:Ca2+-binding RTX toxin-like protein